MNWTFFTIVNGVGVLVSAAAFGWSIAKAFAAGMESARDPQHRVSPAPPWVFFQRALFKSLNWRWPLVWAVAFLCAAYWALFLAPFATIPDPKRNLIALSFLAIFPAFAFWVAAACIALAPRLSGDRLPAAAILGALFAWAVVEFFIRASFSRQGMAAFEVAPMVPGGPVTYGAYDLVPFFECWVALLACVGAWGRAASEGERWFRLEELE
jgi:hypothetical protein